MTSIWKPFDKWRRNVAIVMKQNVTRYVLQMHAYKYVDDGKDGTLNTI